MNDNKQFKHKNITAYRLAAKLDIWFYRVSTMIVLEACASIPSTSSQGCKMTQCWRRKAWNQKLVRSYCGPSFSSKWMMLDPKHCARWWRNLLVRPGKPGHMEVQWIQGIRTHRWWLYFPNKNPKHCARWWRNLFVRPGKPGHMEVQWIQWFQAHRWWLNFPNENSKHCARWWRNLLVRPGKPGHMELRCQRSETGEKEEDSFSKIFEWMKRGPDKEGLRVPHQPGNLEIRRWCPSGNFRDLGSYSKDWQCQWRSLWVQESHHPNWRGRIQEHGWLWIGNNSNAGKQVCSFWLEYILGPPESDQVLQTQPWWRQSWKEIGEQTQTWTREGKSPQGKGRSDAVWRIEVWWGLLGQPTRCVQERTHLGSTWIAVQLQNSQQARWTRGVPQEVGHHYVVQSERDGVESPTPLPHLGTQDPSVEVETEAALYGQTWDWLDKRTMGKPTRWQLHLVDAAGSQMHDGAFTKRRRDCCGTMENELHHRPLHSNKIRWSISCDRPWELQRNPKIRIETRRNTRRKSQFFLCIYAPWDENAWRLTKTTNKMFKSPKVVLYLNCSKFLSTPSEFHQMDSCSLQWSSHMTILMQHGSSTTKKRNMIGSDLPFRTFHRRWFYLQRSATLSLIGRRWTRSWTGRWLKPSRWTRNTSGNFSATSKSTCLERK